jgi:cysteine desulfurase/selenocysteine lyase
LPYKFEAGTPNIADVIAFKKSLEYLENLGWENIKSYENELTKYLLDKMAKLDFIQVYGVKQFSILNSELSIKKLPLVAFNINGVHPHDVGTILDEQGIAVRTGHHCTQLIMKKLNIPASVRASLAFYNTKEEIDLFIEGLRKVRKVFE